MTPIQFVILAVVPLMLLISGTRWFIGQVCLLGAQALIWLIQQIWQGTPGWLTTAAQWIRNARTAATGPIVTALTWLGWILAILVVAIAAGITSGNTLALAAIAMVLGTIAYLVFRTANVFGGTWGAGTALVLYGLAVLGFLFPAVSPVDPKYVVAGLLVWAMIGILWRLSRQTHAATGTPTPTRLAIWSGRAIRTVVVLVLVGGAAVLMATQVGWLDLRVGRAAFTNRVLNDQASTEVGFHEQVRTAIDDQVRKIHRTLAVELDKPLPDPSVVKSLKARLERLKAVAAEGQSVNPTVSSGNRIQLPRFNEETRIIFLVGLVVLAIGTLLVARIFSGRSGAAHH